MLTQSKARIFLSAQRSEIQTNGYRSHGSLSNNGFGAVSIFDDVTLAGGECCRIGGADLFVLIPLVGTIYFENARDASLVNPGQALFVSVETTISNPYREGLVNFIRVGISVSHPDIHTMVTSFDIDSSKNDLINIAPVSESVPLIKIGKFDGRAETIHPLQSTANGTFVHVITGAFEVQYRLLEARDSLAVWDTEALDIEALSNEAILLLIETSLPAETA